MVVYVAAFTALTNILWRPCALRTSAHSQHRTHAHHTTCPAERLAARWHLRASDRHLARTHERRATNAAKITTPQRKKRATNGHDGHDNNSPQKRYTTYGSEGARGGARRSERRERRAAVRYLRRSGGREKAAAGSSKKRKEERRRRSFSRSRPAVPLLLRLSSLAPQRRRASAAAVRGLLFGRRKTHHSEGGWAGGPLCKVLLEPDIVISIEVSPGLSSRLRSAISGRGRGQRHERQVAVAVPMMALIECKGSELALGVQGRWAEIFRTKRGSEARIYRSTNRFDSEGAMATLAVPNSNNNDSRNNKSRHPPAGRPTTSKSVKAHRQSSDGGTLVGSV